MSADSHHPSHTDFAFAFDKKKIILEIKGRGQESKQIITSVILLESRKIQANGYEAQPT